jgi:hypothetical protein
MKNDRIDVKKACAVFFGDEITSYTYKRVFGRLDVKAQINDYFIRKIENKIIPWYANWCQPWPVDYLNREPFRGINGFLLRSNYSGFCPYWLPESHVDKKGILPRRGEKGTPVILKKDGVSCIETFFNLEQLVNIEKPAIKKPVKPAINEVIAPVRDFFQNFKTHDDFNYTIADFKGQDPDFYVYLLFQYYCYNWYCETYKKELSFTPCRHNKETLIYQIGASFLAAYCLISTPFYSTNGYDRNLWKMLLQGDCNAIYEATAVALKMVDAFLAAVEMRKAS